MSYRFLSKTILGLVSVGFVLGCSEATSEAPEPVQSQPQAEAKQSELVKTSVEDSIRKTIAEQLGPVPVEKIKLSPMPGFYEVIAQGQVIYISDDQKYLFPGPLLAVENAKLVNLTNQSLKQLDLEKAPERAKLMSAVDSSDMVVFKSPQEKHVVNVFTDVDCAYCRRLHQNMDGYLSRGITIQYLAFPRAGIGSGAYNKLVSVWCAKDRQSAMDDAKLNNKFEPKECENPVANQFTLVRKLGLTGTPALILSDGELISGFMEPDKLANYLNSKEG